jgi:dTDP-4-dehydrorhamnose 3,5-epimerase-like enzyme
LQFYEFKPVDDRRLAYSFALTFVNHLKHQNAKMLKINNQLNIPLQKVLSKEAHVFYKCTAVYDAKTEYGIDPFDTDLNIQWPCDRSTLVLSDKDSKHPGFRTLGS